MSTRRAAVAVLAVSAVAGAGVAAGVFLTRGTPGPPAASSSASTSAAPVTGDAGFESISPTPTDSIGPDPDAGQVVATDAPFVATGAAVPVTVTYFAWDADADEVQLAGFVGGVVEDGGVCTLTLTKDGATVTGRRNGLADASTTSCGEVSVPGDQLASGTWQAVLSYSSPGHTGTSEAVDVEVTS